MSHLNGQLGKPGNASKIVLEMLATSIFTLMLALGLWVAVRQADKGATPPPPNATNPMTQREASQRVVEEKDRKLPPKSEDNPGNWVEIEPNRFIHRTQY